MRIKLIARALWKHHRRASIITLFGLLALLAVPVAFLGSTMCPSSGGSADSDHASLVIDRVWFDRYPTEPRTEMALWVWQSNGIGAFQQGSLFRASFDIFEFSRSGQELQMSFLQDGEAARTSFTVEHCDVEPPFDLCLTLDNPVRGPTRYFSFSDERSFDDLPAWSPSSMQLLQPDIDARAAAAR